ncbi:hypothetical protein [uncultured Ruegeria sp.]|uniref:hypothetical protein n=1 Tax=uncultured Ruegeria sp. TaxID=259304 RepID=UPI002633349B|nr:hypothetical protein [uncultured Ruegeria sp.]
MKKDRSRARTVRILGLGLLGAAVGQSARAYNAKRSLRRQRATYVSQLCDSL